MATFSKPQGISERSLRLRSLYDRFYREQDYVRYEQDFKYVSFLLSLLHRDGDESPQVLDVGCGTGSFSGLFRESGAATYGVDISGVGLEKALVNAPSVRFVQADACRLPFRSGSFDMVFSRGMSLFNVDDLSSVSPVGRELIRVIKDQGLLVFAWSSNLRGTWRKHRGWRDHRLEEITGYLDSLGLRLVEAFFIERRIALRVLGRHVFRGFLGPLLPVIARVSGLPGEIVCIGRKAAPPTQPAES